MLRNDCINVHSGNPRYLEWWHRQVMGAEIATKAILQISQLPHDEHFPQHLTSTLTANQVAARQQHPRHVKHGREGAPYVPKQINPLRLLDRWDTNLLDIPVHLPTILGCKASVPYRKSAAAGHRKPRRETSLLREDGSLAVVSDSLEHLKQTLSKTHGIEAGSILLFDKGRQDFSIKHSWGFFSNRALMLLRSPDLVLLRMQLLTRKKPILLRMSDDTSNQLNHDYHDVDPASHRSQNCLIVPVISSDRALVAVGLFRDNHTPITNNEVSLLEPFAVQILWGYVNFELVWNLSVRLRIISNAIQVGHKKIQRLSRELRESLVKERRHIARELHDEIGQDLTALSLILQSAQRDSTDPVRIKLKEGVETALHLLKKVREFTIDLHFDQLEERGLMSALTSYLDRYSSRVGIQVAFYHDSLQRRYHRELEVGIYRLVQEALTNIARHAQVNKASVSLRSENQQIILRISDEGAGFDVEKAFKEDGRYGLKGMQERVKRLGGDLKVYSSIHKGTVTEVTLPVELQERHKPLKDTSY